MNRIKQCLLILPFFGSSSAFAQEAQLTQLPASEQTYHSQIMDYALDYTKAGEVYEWHSYGGSGKIAAEAPFISKSKSNCRNFSETFTIGSLQGSQSGIACKRTNGDGWCLLKPTDALTCAMETTPIIPGVNIPQNDANVNVPNAGGVGQVGSPNVSVNPNVNTNIDTSTDNRRESKPGEPVADTVTGTAGRAAGPATGGAIKWFSDTFR